MGELELLVVLQLSQHTLAVYAVPGYQWDYWTTAGTNTTPMFARDGEAPLLCRSSSQGSCAAGNWLLPPSEDTPNTRTVTHLA